MDSRFRDPADRPSAAHRPDPADSLDSSEDRLLEIIGRQAIALPASVSRQWFVGCVQAVILSALQEAAHDDSLREELGIGPSIETREAVARVLAELIDAKNPRLQAKCMDFVFGLGLNQGRSQTQIAAEEGVGKATVSKRCKTLQKSFGVPPSRGMKTEDACQSYSKRQEGKRARPKPEPWSFFGLLRKAYGV